MIAQEQVSGIPDFLRVENRTMPFPGEDRTMSKAEVIDQPNGQAATAVAVQAPSSVPAQGSETSAIIAMIERAARDKTVNVEKMRELLAMRKEILAQEAEENFNLAMTLAQGEMRPVAADASNPQTKSRYASYFALDKVVRPVYTKHGFALSFDTGEGAPAGEVRVVCFVSHGRHTRKYHADLPADGKGAKGGDVMTKTHATGSAMSYGQRYLLKMIFNISVGEDDDGNKAGGTSDRITQDQVATLQAVIDEVQADKARFLTYMSKAAGREVAGLADIPVKHFSAAITALNMKRNAR
jgi:ERF superfamily protein